MKNNDLKKLLKQEANKIEINDYSEDILLRINPNRKEEKVPKPKHLGLKIFIPSLVGVLAVILLVFILFKPGTNITPTPGGDIKPNYTLTRAKKIFGSEILAGGSILSNSDINPIKRMKANNSIYEREAKSIHKYLEIGEMMLDKDGIKIEVLENQDSDYSKYAIKMVVTYNDDSLSCDYIFYYNEKASLEANDNDDMDEINSEIEGLIIIDSKEYLVSGNKEVENDEFETDLKIAVDKDLYILVEQETEVNENELSYTFIKNGKTIKELSQEFDSKKNKVGIEAKEYLPNKTIEYETEFIFNSDNTISCEYEKEIDEAEVEFKVLIIKKKDLYEYHFKLDEEEVVVNIAI